MGNYFLWLAKLITFVIVVFFIIPALFVAAIASGISTATSVKEIKSDKKSVAVVSLDGMIEDSKDILNALHKNIENEKVSGIVLRINSPGGAVGPSQDIYSAVKKLKEQKPIVVSMGNVAASGGFYAALGASKIYSQPGTITGSIGVILQIPNFKGITEKVGFDMVTVKSGDLKDVGNVFRDMQPHEKDFLQNTVGVVHADFVDAIVESRGIDKEKVKSFADGRIIIGTQAKELNLVDEFGDVYEAARSVFDILGEPLKEGEYPRLIYTDQRLESLRRFIESVGKLPQLLTPSISFNYM